MRTSTARPHSNRSQETMAAAVFRQGVQTFRPVWHSQQGTRGMATLKELKVRLKSVKNIEKITKSMKMVSAAKYAQAERQLKPARIYGVAAQAVLEKAEVVGEERSGNHLFIIISSDRGLCGSIHSNLARTIRPIMEQRSSSSNTYFVCVGDKIRTVLQRNFRDNMFMTFNEVGKRPPVFVESTAIAHTILNSGLEFDSAEIIYNRFKNVISYQTSMQPYIPLKTLTESENLLAYDDVDADVLQCYHEMTLANLLFHCMKEGACSEQSSRMTAMDSASKNAKEMIDSLTLTFNRTRQAVITRELIEIISGAAAV